MRYCITHEMVVRDWETESEISDCLIAYTSPPDELDLDGWEFIFSLPAPSDDELVIMDMNAEVLEADFIGE